MLNPDRAEFGLQSASVPENPKKNGHLPRWLRTPAFTARTFLAILTAAPGVVIATDAIIRTQNPAVASATENECRNAELDYIGIGFADDPLQSEKPNLLSYTNRPQFLDYRDIWISSPQFGSVVVQYTENPSDPNTQWRELGRYNMINNGTYSLARIRLDGLNFNSYSSDGRPRLVIRTYYEDDKDGNGVGIDTVSSFNSVSEYKKRGPQGQAMNLDWVFCGNTKFSFYHGRIITDEEIEKVVKDPNFIFRRFASVIADFYTGEAGVNFKKNVDNKPISQEDTRQAFQKYLDGKKKQVYPPTALPISTPTRTITPTPSPTSATGSALIRVTPTAIRIPEAVISPIPPSSAVSTEKSSDLPAWLLGLGAFFLAGLAANEFYKRWKSRKGATVGAGAGSGAAPIFSLGGVIGAGGPSNPNTAPSTGPSQPKTPNPEWIIGQQEFEKRWQAAKSKLSSVQPGDTGNEPEYILDRFKAGMNMVHEVSLDDAIKVSPMATRVRAGIEYLIPEIWSDHRIFKRFFDPQFNAGFLTPEDLARIIYLPEQYRSLSQFTDAQKKDVRRIHRILMHALHPDNSKSEADPKLQDTIDDLLKKINPAWSYIDRLIK